MNSDSQTTLSRKQLTVEAVLITLIVVGTVLRIYLPFAFNPFDSLFWDCSRHLHNAYDVLGDDIESLLNCPGFEIYLSTVLRILGANRALNAAAMAALSAVTPWLWYCCLKELKIDKTVALFGYAVFAFLPSYLETFSFFMDSVILLPLTGAGLWLTFRSARKGTFQACLLAAVVCAAACATKAVAVPVTVLPWLYVWHELAKKMPKPRALAIAGASVLIILCGYGLGPFKVWARMDAFVPLPDGMMNQRYFESGAVGFQVDNKYNRVGEGGFVQGFVCESGSPYYPPFYPFSEWKSSRTGRYFMNIDYTTGKDACKPIKVSFKDRLRYTFENIVFFFFQYQWPEEKDSWNAPFPQALPSMVRFIWFPLTLFIFTSVLRSKSKEFLHWYFIALTLIFMFQQSGVMEGRYKKLWEGVAIAAFLSIVSGSRPYQNWKRKQMEIALVEANESS